MKLLVILSMGLLLTGLVMAQRDPVCFEKPSVSGLCSDVHSGYTYSAAGHGCESYQAKGCNIHGNFYQTRYECQAKCSGSWEQMLQDFYLRSSNQFGRIVTDVIRAIRNII